MNSKYWVKMGSKASQRVRETAGNFTEQRTRAVKQPHYSRGQKGQTDKEKRGGRTQTLGQQGFTDISRNDGSGLTT